MLYGLSFAGEHCSDYGLTMLKAQRPIMAENNDKYIEIPLRSSSFLHEDNSRKDIIIPVLFSLPKNSRAELYAAARAVGSWLDTSGWQPLVFDDDSGVYYLAKAVSDVTLDQLEEFEEIAEFTVQFRCNPEVQTVGG